MAHMLSCLLDLIFTLVKLYSFGQESQQLFMSMDTLWGKERQGHRERWIPQNFDGLHRSISFVNIKFPHHDYRLF
jgi:hypothetical protein